MLDTEAMYSFAMINKSVLAPNLKGRRYFLRIQISFQASPYDVHCAKCGFLALGLSNN